MSLPSSLSDQGLQWQVDAKVPRTFVPKKPDEGKLRCRDNRIACDGCPTQYVIILKRLIE